jgi:hypothetical protein
VSSNASYAWMGLVDVSCSSCAAAGEQSIKGTDLSVCLDSEGEWDVLLLRVKSGSLFTEKELDAVP